MSGTSSHLGTARVTAYTLKNVDGKHAALPSGWQAQSSNFDCSGVWESALTEIDGKTSFVLKHSWNGEAD
jgi:hypothetical protein